MNPSSNGELLPPVLPEVSQPQTGEVPVVAAAPDMTPMPGQMPGPMPQPLPTSSQVPAMPVGGPQLATPIIADDSDLIEKEWVMKAKQIVAQTKADPYVQTQQVNRMKADYLKKRYNKDIKVDEA